MSIKTKETMVHWVINNISNEPTLNNMARYVGYSPFYCSTKFREYTGMTYKKYLSKCRLEAAINDLIYTNDKIIDIAFRYGYSSSESLTRAFIITYKCSPREYRNKNRII